jgi:LmbE family N-acetylglucosaminyl deacetylase
MKILAIGAHPDDLEYGCGGTLLKYSKKGAKIHLLILTEGEIGGRPEVRKKEQGKSGEILKAKICWGGYSDTKIPNDKSLISKIENTVRIIKPDLILVNYLNDTHQDHRNAAVSAVSATRYLRNVLFYEVPTTVDFVPTVFVDIVDTLKGKMGLLKAHKSQVYATRIAGLNILESAKSCANFRGFQGKIKYAEGFMPLRLALKF